jgi:hypothetical protein
LNTKLENAVKQSRLSYLALTDDEKKERDCIRLRNTYTMVKELFPDLDSKRALIVTGAVLEALFN